MALTPLQIGVPGAPELLVVALLFVIPFGLAYWTYRDATARGDENAASWAVSMFLFTLLGLLPALVALGLWTTVRGEKTAEGANGPGPSTA
jgi:uncharacterized membrane protein